MCVYLVTERRTNMRVTATVSEDGAKALAECISASATIGAGKKLPDVSQIVEDAIIEHAKKLAKKAEAIR
jgi:hypothetical protein